MAEFDEYCPTYEDDINRAIAMCGKPRAFYTKVKAQLLGELLDDHFPGRTAIDVLDFGCGSGDIHAYLQSSHPTLNLTGIDVSEEFLKIGRARGAGVTYDRYNGERLPYPDASFDLVFTICVLHHVPTAQRLGFLAEMRRVARPGGLVVVIEHNPLNPLTVRVVRKLPCDRNAVLLSAGELASLMQRAGVARPRCEFIVFNPFESAFFRRLDRLMKHVPFGAQYLCFGHVAERVAQ